MMLRFTLLLLSLLLVACENQVQSNVGALEPISLSGYVLSGNVRNASVQAVGIDGNGQPNRNSSGEYYADKYVTDEQGRYEVLIQGAYAGSLLMVASYHEFTDENGVINKTQIRCAVSSGCKDGQAQNVVFGDWFDAPQDFELHAVVADVSVGSSINITPITHLAARLAYAQFVSDGLSCTELSCEGNSYIDGVFTKQTIHSANSKIQQVFAMDSGFHVNNQPWSEFISTELDPLLLTEHTKHGLFVLAVQALAVSRSETFTRTLTLLTDSLLSNKGQFFQDAHSLLPDLISAKQLFDLAIAQADILLSKVTNVEAVSAARTALLGVVFDVTDNALTQFQGDDYAEGLEAKIIEIQALVGEVQGWLTDLSVQQYGTFFDAEIANHIGQMDVKIEQFKNTLAPQMQGLFLPLVQFVQHNLTCMSATNLAGVTTACADGALKSQVAFNPQTSVFSFEQSGGVSLSMTGKFAQSAGSSELVWYFSFLGEARVETPEGRVTTNSKNGILPNFIITLESPLLVGEVPAIKNIAMELPSLVVTAKDMVSGGFLNTQYQVESLQLTMLGVKDALNETGPTHYNIQSVSIPGQVVDGPSDFANKLDVGITVNSTNADRYYGATVFPDLNFVLDVAAFKTYAKFGGVDYSSSQLAGWLTLPSDVVLGETQLNAISYEEKLFSALDAQLQALLGISDSEQASAQYGALNYPGGIAAIVIWKPALSDAYLARSCDFISGSWSCGVVSPLANLGCGVAFEQTVATVGEAFTFLKDNGCIPQVTIIGRGIYDVNYPANYEFNAAADQFSMTLNKPYYLGLETFNLRLLTRFFNTQGDALPVGFLNVLGSATDEENATIGISLTHDYVGYGSFESLGLLDLVPYGERTLWFTMGKQASSESDALVYYFQKGSVNFVMSAFDNPGDTKQPVGYFRYSGELIGTLHKEGSLYVIRYIDGSWQLL